MPRDRQKRSASPRVFLLTGVDQNERATLGKSIKKLGAVCVKTEHFQSNATHVVCGKLSRSEKFLGALTLGRWVVRPEYVSASVQAGKWLDEVDYEWSSLNVKGHDSVLAAAAKRNRWRACNSTEKIFADWQVAVVMSDTRRQAVYKRLLVSGGAKVMDLKLPVKNPSKCSEYLTYLFSDQTLTPLTQSLQNHGVLCLNADFISDCIVLHPSPDPLEYMLMSDGDSPKPHTVPTGSVLDNSGRADIAAAGRPTPSTSVDSRDSNDMLVFSQCFPSQKHADTSSFGNKKKSGCGGVENIAMDTGVSAGRDFEELKREPPVTDADGDIITCGETGPLSHSCNNDESVFFGKDTGPPPLSNDDVVIVSGDSEADDDPVACERDKHSAIRLSQQFETRIQKRESVKEDLQTSSDRQKTLSGKHKQGVNSTKRNTTQERNFQEGKPNNRVPEICHKVMKAHWPETGSTRQTENKMRAGFGKDQVHLKPMAAGCRDRPLVSAACPAVMDSCRSLASSSGLPSGSSQPCPVLLTAVKPSIMVTSLPSSASTTVAASQSLLSASVLRTSTQPSSSTSVLVMSSQSSSSVSTVVTSQSSSTSVAVTPSLFMSSVSATETPSPGKRKRSQNGHKKVKKDVIKSPFKQSLVPTTPRKVQTSLQSWFLPTGKENTNKSKTVTDSTAKSERENSLAQKIQHQNRLTNEKPVQKTVQAKSETLKLSGTVQSKCMSSEKSERTAQVCKKLVLSSPSGGVSEQNAVTVKRVSKGSHENGVKLPPLDNALILKSNLASTIPSLSHSKCGVDLNGVTIENPISASQPEHTSVSEVCLMSEDTLVAKKPEESQSSDDKFNSVLTVSETEQSLNDTNKQCNCKASLENDSASVNSTAAPHTSSHKQKSVRMASSVLENERNVCVLSPRSVNQMRYGKRTRTHTVLMKNYLDNDMLRKKRKTEEPVEIVVEQSSPQKRSKEKEQTKTSKVKRRKTVRGLSVRTELRSDQSPDHEQPLNTELRISFENEPNPRSQLSVHPRLSPEDNKTGSVVANCSVTTMNHIKPQAVVNQTSHSQQRKRNGQNTAAESQTSSKKSGVRWLLPSTRWRLSHVPLPKQFDLTDCSGSSLESLGSRTVIPESLGLMVSSCLDENYFHSAVAMAHSAVNSCPSVDLFRQMVVVIKEADNHMLVNEANAVVMSWLDQFPPVTSNLRSIYEEALGLNDWENCRKVLENALTEAEKETATETCHGALMVLRIVMAVLEKNFLYFAHNVSRQNRYNCLIIRCLWSPSYQVYPNGRTRDLMAFLERALKFHNSLQACWGELLSLVSMATHCCYLADRGWQWGVEGHPERCSRPMVQELAQAITGGGVDSAARLQQVLSSLCPPWLLRQVSATLLGDYDDYLVPGDFMADPITLKTIVSRYFFLLPRLTAVDRSENSNPRKKLKRDSEEKDENKAITVDPKLTAAKINKKNPKGETMLHRAAIKNNISQLKQMLTVPGVDVNSQDYAGWTALHEACNHGHVECVRALLKFVPSATLDSFFHAGTKGKKVRKVDLNVGNDEGITALHDAVLMNHVSVVRLLLKYGGPSLLKAKTVLGYTALDLAKTEEMRQLLVRDTMDLSLSQDSFSQELDSQDRECVPSSFMYHEVLDSSSGHTQVSASREEVCKFLTLLTLLVRSHLQVQQQQRQLQQSLGQVENGSQQEAELDTSQEDVKFYVHTFERHVKKIASEEVFRGVRVQLCVLEALLTDGC